MTKNEKLADYANEGFEVATFAGGCFWCVEAGFEKLDGVEEVVSGYTGGDVENPTYEQVSSGVTGHVEAVQVYYDPEVITYGQLVNSLWRQTNPTDNGGQFYDRGKEYRTGIFYHNEQQRVEAEKSKAALNASGRFDKPVLTELHSFTKFWPAEDKIIGAREQLILILISIALSPGFSEAIMPDYSGLFTGVKLLISPNILDL